MKARSCRRPGDRGFVTVLFALCVVAVVLITALVIDQSFVRNTRQDSKRVTDATTAAAMQSLATSDGKIYPWAGACAGLAYLRANSPGTTYTIQYMDGNGTALTTSPCTTALDQRCLANTKTTWAWVRAIAGDRVVEIRAGYEIPDPSFAEDASIYAGDVGNPVQGNCDHVATISANVDAVFFGGIAGATPYATAIRSVGRAELDGTNKTPPAFLMLERTECDVLNQQVGSGQGIAVQAASATQPGRIHVDSSATASSCSGNAAGGFAAYSATLGSGQNQFPGLRIYGTATNPGQMTIRALDPSVGNVARAWSTSAGVCTSYVPATNTCLETNPQIGPVVGRAPVDDKYNPTPASGPSFMQNWHATAVVDARRTAAPPNSATATWRTVNTCSNHTTNADDAAATHVFVNCPDGYSPTSANYAAAREVIFNGPINLSGTLRMPVATRVIVGGTTSGGITTSGGSVLTINTAVTPTVADYSNACAATDGPPNVTTPGGTDTNRRIATLTVFGGSSGALVIGGVAAFCQTSVYLAGPKEVGNPPVATSYQRLSTTSTAVDPTCAQNPCPLTSALPDAGFRILSGGGPNSSRVRWSAPNRMIDQPGVGAAGTEDLALWAESADGMAVFGELDVNGVVYLPNGEARMQSPSSFTPRDAQFIARKLKLLQGALLMAPSPGNTVLVDSLKGVGLVR